MSDLKIDIIKVIQSRFSFFSRGHRSIAEFILNNYDKAAFMTAAKLGNVVGVSESTVVRFATSLGCDGYPMLQNALQDMVKNRLTTVERLDMPAVDGQSLKNDVRNVLRTDLNNIKYIMEHINYSDLELVAKEVLKARRVYVVALRSSLTLSQYLCFYLNYILDNVVNITAGISDTFEQLIRVDSYDLVIGISYPRYSQKTIDSLKYAKDRGARIVSITDSYLSPLSALSDYTLVAQSTVVSFIDSLVAPMSLINMLVYLISLDRKPSITKTLQELELVWDTYKVYNVDKDSIMK